MSSQAAPYIEIGGDQNNRTAPGALVGEVDQSMN